MMDPIGLALENFNAVGVWRDTDSGAPVDPSGQLFDGTPLDGPVSLRNAVLAHSDSFVTTFAENFLSYGLGRHARPARHADGAGHRPRRRRGTTTGCRASSWASSRACRSRCGRPMRPTTTVSTPPARPAPRAVARAGSSERKTVQESHPMYLTRKALSRRTVLRGMGAAVSLPLLEAMVPARTLLRAHRRGAEDPAGLHRDGARVGRQHPARHGQALLDARDGRARLRVHADPRSRSSRSATTSPW